MLFFAFVSMCVRVFARACVLTAVARLIQERLQKLSESVLPESQCGFRKREVCNDMIFVS